MNLEFFLGTTCNPLSILALREYLSARLKLAISRGRGGRQFLAACPVASMSTLGQKIEQFQGLVCVRSGRVRVDKFEFAISGFVGCYLMFVAGTITSGRNSDTKTLVYISDLCEVTVKLNLS